LYSIHYSYQIVMNLWIFSTNLLKNTPTSIKFHENPSSGIQVVLRGRADGWTDQHDKANCRFYSLCKHLKMVKTVCIGHGICLCCFMLTDGWTDRQTREK
jgi:hypothetical protein